MDGVILDPFGPFQSAPGRCHCGAKKGARQAGTHECPVSEVRDTPQHTLTRTSETKGHSQLYGSRAAFDLKFLTEFAAGGVGTSNRRHERFAEPNCARNPSVRHHRHGYEFLGKRVQTRAPGGSLRIPTTGAECR